MVRGVNAAGEQSLYTYNALGALVNNAKVGGTAPKVSADYVLDYTTGTEVPLVETESGGNTYQNTYGIDTASGPVNYTAPSQVAVYSPDDSTGQDSFVTGWANGAASNPARIYVKSANAIYGAVINKLYLENGRLGSTKFAAADNGADAAYLDYNEWGIIGDGSANLASLPAAVYDNLKSYTGHSWDGALGLYYAKARMYDPDVKRFTQIDPAKSGNNWYNYVDNNPVNSIDPLGLNPYADNLPQGIKNAILSSNQSVYLDQNICTKVRGFVNDSLNDRKSNGETFCVMQADRENRILYSAISKLVNYTRPVDNVTLQDRLKAVSTTITAINYSAANESYALNDDKAYSFNPAVVIVLILYSLNYELFVQKSSIARAQEDSSALSFASDMADEVDYAFSDFLFGKSMSDSVNIGPNPSEPFEPCPLTKDNEIISKGAARVWTSDSPYVADMANAIEQRFPGKIKSLERLIYKPDGGKMTDLDIEFDDLIIQVKSGVCSGLITQMNKSATTGKTVISLTPDIPQNSRILKDVRTAGYETFTTFNEVLNYLDKFFGNK
jgi:RHS repeat-associated protein